MPPRKSTSSLTPADADADDSIQLSPQTQTDKPVTATEQQLKARAEAGVSVEASAQHKWCSIYFPQTLFPGSNCISRFRIQVEGGMSN